MMKDRDCEHCINHTENGCRAWDCGYINVDDAAEAFRKESNHEDTDTDCD